LLYDKEDVQCHQCGLRYPPTEAGQLKMKDHLDWHFRQNRRIKEKDQKTISRDWYLTVDDWVEDRDIDVADKMGK
jgi:pre-mRNA cleavage complex 2 protein Pcf11